jgi:hypothetical protein
MTMPSTQGEAFERRDLFLSHRSIDKELARKLAADIEAEKAHGRALRVWLDEAEIPLGGSIPGHINRGLETSRFVLVLMTPGYFDSPSGWTDAEWHAALSEDPDNRRHRLIPCMGADCPYIPFLLRHLRGADLRGDKYENGLQEILRALKGEPLPRPVTHRGQLIAPSGKIDRSQLVAERSVLDASPDAIAEILQCNLLPVERLPVRIWTAPLDPDVMVRKGRGTATPAKSTLIEAARAGQKEAGYETIFTPAFRVVSGQVISFHDLSEPDGPAAAIVDDGAAEEFLIKEYMVDEDQRRVAISLLNMAISRHAHRCGLTVDGTRPQRYFFPPKGNGPNVINWKTVRMKASRTVAKPVFRSEKLAFWVHLGAYLKMLYLADKLYLQIEPTWVLTEDGNKVKGGPDIGRIVIKWTGQERNLQVFYHVKLWSAVLRKRRPGPISIYAGDQTLEIGQSPVFCQMQYGIASDRRDLLNGLDREAQLLGDEEERLIEEVVADEGALAAAEEEAEAEDDDGPSIVDGDDEDDPIT